MVSESNIPIGTGFLGAIREQEALREAELKRWLASEIAANGPDLLETLGTGLSFLDRIPSSRTGLK